MAENSAIYALPKSYSGIPISHATGANKETVSITFNVGPEPAKLSKQASQPITISLADASSSSTVDNPDKVFALPQHMHQFPSLNITEERGNGVPSALSLLDDYEASAPPLTDADLPHDLKSSIGCYYPGKSIKKFQFHQKLYGSNVWFDHGFTEATRMNPDCQNAYIFSEYPLKKNETVLIQISKLKDSNEDSLTFGVTSCNINILKSADLPSAHVKLLDKPDYWAYKENINGYARSGEILGFTLSQQGHVILQINNEPPKFLMQVDGSVKLWMFLDVIGQVTSVKSVGRFEADSFINLLMQDMASMDKSGNLKKEIAVDNEVCIICMDRPKEMACIPCGHLIMCSKCASQIACSTNQCPLCQKKIESLQRIFK